MDSTYTLIAYKPNSSASSRGCTTDWYSAGFIFNTDLNREELVVSWYSCLILNQNCDHQEAEYDLIVMKDGKVVYDTINYEVENNDPEIQEILSEAKQLLHEYIRKAEENKRKNDELEAQRKIDQKNKADRTLYEKLKQQFESNED